MNRIYVGFTTAVTALISTISCADWPMPQLNSGHVSWRPEVAAAANVANAPAWRAGTDVAAPIAPCIVGNTVYVVTQTGEDWYVSEPASCKIEARKTADGSLVWRSPELDASSVSESTLSGITADVAGSSLFYATGSTMYSLSMSTGMINWQSSIADAVTTFSQPGVSGVVVNASPSFNGDKVFINTRDYSSTGSVLLAFDKATGVACWQALNVGLGLNSPIAVTLGEKDVVFAPYSSDGTKGSMQCFDAATGSILWRSTWETREAFWAELVYHDGCLYGSTYGFTRLPGELVCVDALTGSLKWSVDAPFTDTAPLLADDTLFVVGGEWGAAKLYGYRVADGVTKFEPVSLRASLFRNNMAASANRFFISINNRLVSFDFDGVKRDESAEAFYCSAVAIDSDGSVYATAPDYATQTQELVKFEPKSSVDDWQQLW